MIGIFNQRASKFNEIRGIWIRKAKFNYVIVYRQFDAFEILFCNWGTLSSLEIVFRSFRRLEDPHFRPMSFGFLSSVLGSISEIDIEHTGQAIVDMYRFQRCLLLNVSLRFKI